MSSVRDILIIAILLFAVGISIMFSVRIGHDVNTNLLSISTINETAQAQEVISNADEAINSVDYIYLAFFIAFFISIIIFGWLVGGIPILAPIYFFSVILFVFVSIILQNVWLDISTNPEIILTTLDLPITTFILNNLGIFMTVFGLVGIIMMYAKPSSNGGNY